MITIRKRDHAERMARFYRMSLQAVLPLDCELTGVPTWCLVREWGRIGSPGTVRLIDYPDEPTAQIALYQIATVKQRRGYR